MGIILSGVSYTPAGGDLLFDDISFSVPRNHRAALTGDNGTGKTTLLRLISNEIQPNHGSIKVDGSLYYIPQQVTGYQRVCDATGAGQKIDALAAILAGSTDEVHYTLLDDDWEVSDRLQAALDTWGVGYLTPASPMTGLSGGEMTRVMLAGITFHRPDVILFDEPTNHLDRQGREQLYRFISQSPAAILMVSHDRQLLELGDTTYHLSRGHITRYGGNYSFYLEQRMVHEKALLDRIDESDKAIRAARTTAAETLQRKNKADSRGKGKQSGEGVPRIMMNTIRDGAEKSKAALGARHEAKIAEATQQRQELKAKLPPPNAIKVKIDASTVHSGRTLYEAGGINFGYPDGKPLWAEPLDVHINADTRLHIRGGNGSGKTTLIRLITGSLEPTQGTYRRNTFTYVYIDQHYSLVDNTLTIRQQIERYNRRNLPESLLRTELDRYLFPSGTWDKPCGVLSGGERMRLALCCILTADNAPDMLVLDEPTNNLDIRNMEILASAVRTFTGALLVVSHDTHFITGAGIDSAIDL